MIGEHFEIWAAILNERKYQDNKWGVTNPHTVFEWIGIMEKELQEAKLSFFQYSSNDQMLHEVLQVIAVGVACLEQHGVVERK